MPLKKCAKSQKDNQKNTEVVVLKQAPIGYEHEKQGKKYKAGFVSG